MPLSDGSVLVVSHIEKPSQPVGRLIFLLIKELKASYLVPSGCEAYNWFSHLLRKEWPPTVS